MTDAFFQNLQINLYPTAKAYSAVAKGGRGAEASCHLPILYKSYLLSVLVLFSACTVFPSIVTELHMY